MVDPRIPIALLAAGAFFGLGLSAWIWPSPRKRTLRTLGHSMAERAVRELGDALGAKFRAGLKIEPRVTRRVVWWYFRFRRIDKLVFRVRYTGDDDIRGVQAHVEFRIASYIRESRKLDFRYGFEFIQRGGST